VCEGSQEVHQGLACKVCVAASRHTICCMQELEAFYRSVHALAGVDALALPRHYPTSALLGAVTLVDCLPVRHRPARRALAARLPDAAGRARHAGPSSTACVFAGRAAGSRLMLCSPC